MFLGQIEFIFRQGRMFDNDKIKATNFRVNLQAKRKSKLASTLTPEVPTKF